MPETFWHDSRTKEPKFSLTFSWLSSHFNVPILSFLCLLRLTFSKLLLVCLRYHLVLRFWVSFLILFRVGNNFSTSAFHADTLARATGFYLTRGLAAACTIVFSDINLFCVSLFSLVMDHKITKMKILIQVAFRGHSCSKSFGKFVMMFQLSTLYTLLKLAEAQICLIFGRNRGSSVLMF